MQRPARTCWETQWPISIFNEPVPFSVPATVGAAAWSGTASTVSDGKPGFFVALRKEATKSPVRESRLSPVLAKRSAAA